MSVRGYFVQYKFILPDNIKHSSYTYQKLFRAIYGYTQAVYKSNGKTYHYYRPGVLSNVPFIRPGKNCVIIPQSAFQKLQEFFKTGQNPTHEWSVKGDWKCTYFLNEKDISEKDIIIAVEELLSRKYIEGNEGLVKLSSEIDRILNLTEINESYKNLIINEAQKIIENIWFKEIYSSSPVLLSFYQNFKKLTN
ncbi:MAG: hypothetical protein PHX27_00050 [Candidatus ainarchaeum sp.]|nr:hypothetical protein [Candidatus ainarchaeum sp.]